MPRSRLLLGLVAAACVAGVGCAHCDTCDDFPVPCASGDCGFGPAPVMAPTVVAPAMMGAPVVDMPAPVIRSQPAGGAAANSSAPAGGSTAPEGGDSGVPAPLPAGGNPSPFSPMSPPPPSGGTGPSAMLR